jgi:hypothetical protein
VTAYLVVLAISVAPLLVALAWVSLTDGYAALKERRARRRRAQLLLPSAFDLYVRQRARKNEAMRQIRTVVREHRDHPQQ